MDTAPALFNEPLDNHWMPYTANRQFREQPRIIVRAEGIHYWNPQGDRLIDSISGLYTTPAGHGRAEIREAVTKQLAELDYAPAFQFGTPGSFRLASELAAMTPGATLIVMSSIPVTSTGFSSQAADRKRWRRRSRSPSTTTAPGARGSVYASSGARKAITA